MLRLILSAFITGIPETKLRIIAPDVGGGFGSKIYCYAEETVCLWATKRIGRPVRWTADRNEAFLADAHGRDHVTHVEMAMDAEGHFLGLKVDTTANMGAYLSNFASCIPTYLYATLLAGQYRTPVVYCNVRAVFTNTAPVDAYRGAGRPEATYLLERTVEIAAREMGLDPAEIRRRNFIQPDQFPLPDASGTDLRHRRLRSLAERGHQDDRLPRLRPTQGGRHGARQAPRHWFSPPISRPAASRRRLWSARWGPASGFGSRHKCVSTRPAPSRC